MIKQMQLKAFLKKYPYAACVLPKYIDMSDDKYFVRFNSSLTLVEFGYLSDNWALQLSE